MHPGQSGSPTWGEIGCFWHAFPGTGREDAPVHTNQKMSVTGFSPEPNETLGDPNGAFPVRGPSGFIRAQPSYIGDAVLELLDAASRYVGVPL